MERAVERVHSMRTGEGVQDRGAKFDRMGRRRGAQGWPRLETTSRVPSTPGSPVLLLSTAEGLRL